LVFILSLNEQKLAQSRRFEIEAQLSNYNIPVQILQIVADRCECEFDTRINSRQGPKKSKLSALLSRLNDESIMLLEQIFLDCRDSFSVFRFAVFLSSIYSPTKHKFVMEDKITGESGLEYSTDVCIYSRATEDLVAIGLQNNDKAQKAANSKSLAEFLRVVNDILPAHSRMQGAYYSSSYGYEDDSKWSRARRMGDSEVRFFNYKDKIYIEILSN
jgi:hypothetical protein